MPLYYSDFNDPSELSNYYYHNDSYRGVQITNGYLEVFLGLYGKSTPYTMTCTAVYRNTFPSVGIRIKARVSASDGSSMSNYNDIVSGVKIMSASGFNPSDPTWSNKQIHFGFSSPYLTVIYVKGNNPERVYQSGSWNGSDTGWYTLRVDLYSDHIEFYVNDQLVYTLNKNPFIGDQVYVGIIAGSKQSSSYARADWLEVSLISTVTNVVAYPSISTRLNYVYTPINATAYKSITIQQTYTPPPPPPPVYTPIDARAYASLTLKQEYTMTQPPVYTPIDTKAYASLTLKLKHEQTPTQMETSKDIAMEQLLQLIQILLLLIVIEIILYALKIKKEK
jgi:hypothetical protein